jgi:signal transduction histidine kinase/DNA-binding response OmpR family regulator
VGGKMRTGMALEFQNNEAVKKSIFILRFLVFGLLFLISQNLYSKEPGYKYFKNYTYKEYDHLPQNWGIAQDKNGFIYVANNGGVLVYDGASWEIIGIPKYAPVRSLTIDENGTVYIGGKNKIGYLAPDENGYLQYVSLLDHLDDRFKNFSNVWRTHAIKEGIFFRTSKFLFRWNSREIKVWEIPSFRASFVCNGNLFVQQQEMGLMQVVNDSLKMVPGGETFSEERIWIMVPYDSDKNPKKLLIGTRSKGFYLYDGMMANTFPTEVDDYLKEKELYHGIRLSTGDFALATRLGGLVIMDPNGGLKYIFDKSAGLQDNNVHYVFEDNQGNLWLCLDNGISKIECTSPFFIYDNRINLPTIILSIVRHHSDLYVGTTQGLYVLRPDAKTFLPVPGISNSCWDLVSMEDSILAATSGGVFHIKNNIKRKLVKDFSFVLLPSRRHRGRTWCGTKSGLVALIGEKGQWEEEQRLEIINQEVRFITEEKNGNLWLGTSTGGVLKVDSPVNINHQPPVVTRYDTSHGLPEGRVYVSKAADHIMFATEQGIFRFNDKEERFIPDLTVGPTFAGGPDSKFVFLVVEDNNKNIWLHSEGWNYQAVPGPEGSYTNFPNPFHRIPMIQVNTIYPDPDGKKIWFGSNDGLICYDKTYKKNYDLDIPVFIRKVEINKKTSIFNPHGIRPGNTYHGYKLALAYQDRNLRFKYAAPFFENESATQYRYFLEGYDVDWSDWTLEKQKDYTNLDSGRYRFRVQAKSVYGTLSREGNFQFKILPPWYKTWWAFLLYSIAAILVLYSVVKWRSWKLLREKQRLELIVKKRTTEIKEKNRKLEEQTLQLKDQSEKLKEMDQIKSRFFANISHEFRTPLTLIIGPLEEMLSDIRDNKQKKKINMMLQNSQRLFRLINQLLDLSRIDSGKMRLQTNCQDIIPFVKGILSSFHVLAQHNQLELEFYCEEESISLYFDHQMIEEVMTNLLINAIKFTLPGGKITVSVTAPAKQKEIANLSSGYVEISVEDTGVGIPKDQLPHIFDRFYQVQGSLSRDREHKGTGIGLALIKELVTLHHGKINVYSSEGKGTKFSVHLPMGKEHLKPGDIVAPGTPFINETNTKTPVDRPVDYLISEIEQEKEAAAMKAGEYEESGKDTGNEINEQEKNVILIVEDHADVRQYIRNPLESLYTIVEAKNGKEGIEKAKEIIPDLIVSDILMPGVDGYQLCRELKNDIGTSHIPIVLLTAKASQESIIQGLETGADDYITKPFNSRILLTRIKNLIDLRRQLQLKIQRQKMLLPYEISVSSLDDEFIKKFHEIIEEYLDDPEFTVDILCDRIDMGRSTLFKKIKALTGETPNQFILNYRLERAAQLLKDKSRNVTDVAMEVGFSTPAYFAKCFKDKFHQSPSSFQTGGALFTNTF